ncbi:hypothetical protein GO730_29195 [Spirosoma sp. HMF3257]|uniref:hypothetical protein n=1 Tax=Spirosoma telluris TaxID=2183553 RepID=UPI0011B9483D|nr:hypothetical protein [Spirosoma telluris]
MITNSVAGLMVLAGLISLTRALSLHTPIHSTIFQPAYTSWIAGDTTDAQSQPLGGVVLAGGSTDVDAAMRWFVRRSGGGMC